MNRVYLPQRDLHMKNTFLNKITMITETETETNQSKHPCACVCTYSQDYNKL